MRALNYYVLSLPGACRVRWQNFYSVRGSLTYASDLKRSFVQHSPFTFHFYPKFEKQLLTFHTLKSKLLDFLHHMQVQVNTRYLFEKCMRQKEQVTVLEKSYDQLI